MASIYIFIQLTVLSEECFVNRTWFLIEGKIVVCPLNPVGLMSLKVSVPHRTTKYGPKTKRRLGCYDGTVFDFYDGTSKIPIPCIRNRDAGKQLIADPGCH